MKLKARHHFTAYACAFAFGIYGPQACPNARAEVPEDIPEPVHLKKGQAAPFEGDLVHPREITDLYIDGLCIRENAELEACADIQQIKLKALEAQLKAVEAANSACQLRPPATVEVVKPIPFFEKPVVVLTIGILTGGLLVWAATSAN